jgi:heme/copper-type cytochrome/quinol oxidase subunit 2
MPWQLGVLTGVFIGVLAAVVFFVWYFRDVFK